ncbi:hypothetical protein CR513_54359, partial [Mucuna pruriens]
MEQSEHCSRNLMKLLEVVLLVFSINGHFIWVIALEMCDSDCDCYLDYEDSSDYDNDDDSDDEEEDMPCKPPPPPQRRKPKDGPWLGLHHQEKPELNWMYKRGLEILREEGLLPLRSPAKDDIYRSPIKAHITPIVQAIPCMMFTKSTHNQEFPSLERKIDPVTKIATKPNISSSEVGPDGRTKPLSQAEEVLNWQIENAKVQNSIVMKIDKKFGEASNQKEREVRRLRAELQEMENYMDRKMKEKQESWILPTTGAYRTRTKLESSSRVSREKPTNPSLHNSPESSLERQRSSSQEKQAIPEKEYLQDAQDPYSQFTVKLCPTNESRYNSSSGSKENQSVTSSEASEEEGEYDQPKPSSESSYEDKDDVNIKNILMADTTRSRERTEAIYDSDEEVISSPPQHGPQKPNSGPWFTLDDIPPNKWRSRLIEFGAWLDTKLMKDQIPTKS